MAQKELHSSLDCLDKAIKLLPGASRFLDRQAMVTRGIGTNDTFQQSMDLEVSAPTAKGKLDMDWFLYQDTKSTMSYRC